MSVSRTYLGYALTLVAACSSSPSPDLKGKPDGGAGAAEEGGAGTFGETPDGGDPNAACAPSPANYDFPGNSCDDDADGTVDNPPGSCDSGLAVTGDGAAFASALGICQNASSTKWGLVSAKFTNTHGAPPSSPLNEAQHGILTKFGAVVGAREGASLGVLSSGFARAFDDPGGTREPFKGQKTPMQPTANPYGSLPQGFPKSASGCPSQADASTHDLIDAKLEIKVPRNANGIQYDFNFWSGEWPEYVCSDFNDAFIAYLTSTSGNGNISFDSQNNAVSVNNGFFDRCTPNTMTGCLGGAAKAAVCPGGVAELGGTGFAAPGKYCGPLGSQSSGGGATGWLTSTAPVTPGETIVLEFIIWDVGDANFDSSVLLDHFQWIKGATKTGTDRPPN